ncbi:hypothetical protein D5086_033637 [Populus alba]|uniref:Uncharacterized protein n=1 Tax=Populus alba TaxID=43335 RepID=A0ACC4AHB1_POPAL
MHDSCTAKPLFQVSILLQRKYKVTWKNSRSGELLLENEYPSCPDSHRSCLVPPQLVSSPDSCTSYMCSIVSDMLNLDDVSLCHDVASNIGSFVSDFAKEQAGRQGFCVSAHVVIVEDYVEEVNLDGINVPIFDFDEEDHAVVSRGIFSTQQGTTTRVTPVSFPSVESPSRSFRSYSVSSSDNEGRCTAIANCITRKLSHPPPRANSSFASSSSKVTPQPLNPSNDSMTGPPRLVRSRAVRRDLLPLPFWIVVVVDLQLIWPLLICDNSSEHAINKSREYGDLFLSCGCFQGAPSSLLHCTDLEKPELAAWVNALPLAGHHHVLPLVVDPSPVRLD